MSTLPKLKVKKFSGDPAVEVCDFEQAKAFFNPIPSTLVVVQGEVLYSYDELILLATQDKYKDKKLLEVDLLPIQGGG